MLVQKLMIIVLLILSNNRKHDVTIKKTHIFVLQGVIIEEIPQLAQIVLLVLGQI